MNNRGVKRVGSGRKKSEPTKLKNVSKSFSKCRLSDYKQVSGSKRCTQSECAGNK